MPADPNDRLLSASNTTMDFQYAGVALSAAVFAMIGILAWIPGALDRFIDTQPWWLKTFPAFGIIGGVPMNQVKKVDRYGNWSISIGGGTGNNTGDRTISITFRERTRR